MKQRSEHPSFGKDACENHSINCVPASSGELNSGSVHGSILELIMNLKDQYIRTFTGKKFYPFDPKPEQIDIRDIAAGLSKICRYTGQIPNFYSVAEHSIHVAAILPPHMRLAGLLHDASEAYLADIAKPIKIGLGDYQALEGIAQEAIGKRYGIEIFPEVKEADFQMLLAEFNLFMPEYFSQDFPGLKADPELEKRIYCLNSQTCETGFLAEFERLWRL